jgi:hypothetical protein
MPTVEIPHFIPAQSKNGSFTIVPKRIYQTWKTRVVSEAIAKNIYNLIENNPSYDYYLFGDKECREYLIKNYNEEYIKAFDDLIPGAFKADFWRYAVIAKEGGVYIDADLKVDAKLDDIVLDCNFVSVRDMGEVAKAKPLSAIYQAFIASTPNHPFVLETLHDVLRNIQRHFYGTSCLGITGPVAMGDAVCRLLGQTYIKCGIFDSQQFGRYRFLKFVDISDRISNMDLGNVIVDENNNVVFNHKIDGYQAGDSYASLFYERRVYKSYKRTWGDCLNLKTFIYFILILVIICVCVPIYRRVKK